MNIVRVDSVRRLTGKSKKTEIDFLPENYSGLFSFGRREAFFIPSHKILVDLFPQSD